MEDRHFDALIRGFSSSDSRRRLLAKLGAAAIAGGLLALPNEEETTAAGRRKRRKKRHQHGQNRRRQGRRGRRRKPCSPNSLAQTCAGACGSIVNNCQQAVECGSCVCDPPCSACQTCNAVTRQCIPDPAQQGAACGASTQEQCVDGECICFPDCANKCSGADDGCGGVCTNACAAGKTCLSNGSCAVPCPNGGNDCTAAGCGNRCIGTAEGSVCSLADGAGGCSGGNNADCPTGRACSGAICEVVC